MRYIRTVQENYLKIEALGLFLVYWGVDIEEKLKLRFMYEDFNIPTRTRTNKFRE